MERIGIVGLSLQETDVAGLERLQRPEPERFELCARELADVLGASELVLLTTCNRVEVIFARELGHLPEAADREAVARRLALAENDPVRERMHVHTAASAVRHLFRVACSLDSVVLGEDQILAQVRDAFARCERAGLVGRLLGGLFEHAFQIGKQVRTETELSRIPVSVVSIGLEEIARHFAEAMPRVALVGAGAMAELVVKNAADHGVKIASIANRTLPRAQRLANLCGAEALTLDDLLARRGGFDVIVSATSMPGYVFDRESLLAFARRTPLGRALLAVDLAVPRDIEPVAAPQIEVLDMERLRAAAEGNRALRAAAAAQAEALIEHKLVAFTRRSTQSALNETIAEMRSESQSVFEKELAGLFTGKLAHLPAEDRRAIEHWARTAFGRVSHVPISAIKRLASDKALFGNGQGTEGAA
ncbi:MAG: glutamyl-tRNA reductase [Planctomycetes bacterium]|nr:glutamyl-tRNA reductase [Planctomycetota bacterium]